MAANQGRGAGGEPDRGRSGLPPDVVEDILADPVREAVLRHLFRQSGPVVVSDLAARVAAGPEGETTGEEVAGGPADDLVDELYEHHLPKLTATDVVAYDSMRETVSLAGTADQLRARLEADGRESDGD